MLTKIGFFVLLAGMFATDAAEADKARRYYADPPIKDCTRINGRWGYYGNIWCTPAEQLRWDKWQARPR